MQGEGANVGVLVCTHALRANDVLTLIHLNGQIGFSQPTILRLPRHRAEKATSNLAQSSIETEKDPAGWGLPRLRLFLGPVRIPVDLTTHAWPCGRSSG
jgi:hypothetical protein